MSVSSSNPEFERLKSELFRLEQLDLELWQKRKDAQLAFLKADSAWSANRHDLRQIEARISNFTS